MAAPAERSMPKSGARSPLNTPSFNLVKPFEHELGARLGCFSFPGRQPIETPHYIAISSRGAVPHLSQDTMKESTSIKGLYAGLEDYFERLPSRPPILSLPCPPTESPLRRFIALQRDALLVLGPRRLPPVDSPAPNTYTSLSILTSVGFRTLEVSDYIEAAQALRPDIVVGCADIMYGERRAAAGLKRKEKMGERSLTWMKGLISGLKDANVKDNWITSLWAPVLPIDAEIQRAYLDYLTEEDVKGGLGGVVFYNKSSLASVPSELANLPRLALTEPSSPQGILHEICLGVDIFAIPFLTVASDAGVALLFKFPAIEATAPEKQSLGVDMWSPQHATDLNALQTGCTCYTCSSHHRAFIQHLLSTKEMLGWVLLQIHNHAVLDAFFSGIRTSIANGTFNEDVETFNKAYESELPVRTGTGPRARGYHFHHSGLTSKKSNPSPYRKLPDSDLRLNGGIENLAEDSIFLSSNIDAKDF